MRLLQSLRRGFKSFIDRNERGVMHGKKGEEREYKGLALSTHVRVIAFVGAEEVLGEPLCPTLNSRVGGRELQPVFIFKPLCEETGELALLVRKEEVDEHVRRFTRSRVEAEHVADIPDVLGTGCLVANVELQAKQVITTDDINWDAEHVNETRTSTSINSERILIDVNDS